MTLPPLEASEFPAVFAAVHGVPPFPWQCRLVDRLAAGDGWPDALDLPTGTGKTAAIDAALFHLALQADGEAGRQAPVRIAFVVNRRIIVDAAADRAEQIAKALSDASGIGPLARMAARLRHLAGPDAPPLMVARLRGGLPREKDWARSPGQPTILCSTLDQVGSRLLFRGYGISDSMKPVHAGLLGADCLLLLDEAHLAAPFAQTLRRIAAYRAPPWCEAPPGPWGFVSLSATQDPAGQGFALDADDRAHPILKARLEAPKPATLRALPVQAGTPEHVRAFTDAARELLQPGPPSNIAVVVNRVALARAVFEALTGMDAEALHAEVLKAVHGLRLMAASNRIPPPLEDSPKCPRCSLVSICLPDEVSWLRAGRIEPRPLAVARAEALPMVVQGAPRAHRQGWRYAGGLGGGCEGCDRALGRNLATGGLWQRLFDDPSAARTDAPGNSGELAQPWRLVHGAYDRARPSQRGNPRAPMAAELR